MLIGNPLVDEPVFACYLKGDDIIYAEYISPQSGILRYGDWSTFEELYDIAEKTDTLMYATMRYW